MRLTCPNCDAQYEVPDDVVPTTGRDVQCSNCGQTWFQHHPDHAPQEEISELPEDDFAPDEEVAPPPPLQQSEPAPARKQLDPAVADILRQEAEAEFEARAQRQSEPLESQPDLGLDDTAPVPPLASDDDPERRALEAKKRMARMRGDTYPPDPAAHGPAGSRRELLPDIEEINSTLRNDTAASGHGADLRQGVAAADEAERRSGFRWGFFTIAVIAIALAAVYIYAPEIATAVPALDPFLNTYVIWVDQIRALLDAQVKTLLGWLDTMASEQSN